MKEMAYTPIIGSPRISSSPKPLTWIVLSVGTLAIFIIYASWVLISHPIGAAVQGYFYGVDSTAKLDGAVPSISENSMDAQLNESSDFVGNKPSSDLPSSTTSSSQPRDSGIEGTNTNSNSQVDLTGPTSVTSPIIKEDNGVETSEGEVSNSQKSATSSEKTEESVNSSLPAQSNSQIDSVSTSTFPVAGNDASDVTTSVRTEEPASVELINQSSSVITPSNETSMSSGDSTSTTVPSSLEKQDNPSSAGSVNSECDLYHGSWIHDPLGPLYTNSSCPNLTQMQNCQGNGRPDKDYENWRWKPSQCDLPRFDPKKFLEVMRGKTLAFIGDSVARNQMESLLCMLWQVEEPKNRGNRNLHRYYFRSTSVMIVRIWSSWLVNLFSEPFDFAPAGVTKLHLDAPEQKVMEYIPTFDVVVLSSGHWFAKQSVYLLNNEIVGAQLWSPDKSKETQMKINSIQAFGISVETILTAIATHPNYTGLAIVRSYSPDHYEGGAWNTGGSCTGKVKPLAPDELVENEFTNEMHRQQVDGFNRAVKKATNKSKLRLMDITEAFQYRVDGHPGPYRSPDPNKMTKRGPDGRPPPQDCLHWCMPGPVDTWNEILLEIIKREYDGASAS